MVLPARTRPAWQWLLSYPGVGTITAAVAATGVAALVIMLRVAAGAPSADRATLQIDAIKYGLGIFAASGAAAALLLSIRRQQHLENAQAHTELDAAERRVTDLYTKAVEQLGSADAAVRLGGLYALERVAQNTAGQRQTIVNVLCAYLRMPYAPPAAIEPEQRRTSLSDLPLSPPGRAPIGGRDPHQELQVRLTAQRILTGHLVSDAESFWSGVDLDLTGATLVDWDMRRGRARHARFERTIFSGDASFIEAGIADARFTSATFARNAWFDGSTFDDAALFDTVTFSGIASFELATFTADALFREVTFADASGFDRAAFGHDAVFSGAVFDGETSFQKTSVAGEAWFDEAVFAYRPEWGEATFAGKPRLDDAVFSAGRDPGLPRLVESEDSLFGHRGGDIP
jgi:hypothetical protein